MNMTNVKRSKITNGDVTLAVSEMGQGQTLVFFNGGGATQVSWKRIIAALKGSYRIVTFDFRNHGKSSRSHQVLVDHFLSDAVVVMDKYAGPDPVVIGWSLGSDLAAWYTAEHPGRVAGLYLLDGAVPVNLVLDPAKTRAAMHAPVAVISPILLSLAGRGYRLSPEEYADMTIDLNARRPQLSQAYQRITCPVELNLATQPMGDRGEDSAKKNALWRAGGETLAQAHPEFTIHWHESTHLLPYTKPAELAHGLDAFARGVRVGEPAGHAPA
ncbi:MAG: alpha/beta fold hydrolase [Nitrososphaerota archaeon]